MSAPQSYYVPVDAGETEFTEKRSRFLGHVRRVETEAEARAFLDEMRKKYYDARHNCWCYVLHEGGVVRYGDDGEPQGTAGQPMLNVFQREGVENVLCVVTRYFGGVLLGAPGLVRAYSEAAAEAVKSAQIRHFCEANRVRLVIGYDLYPTVSYLLPKYGVMTAEQDFGEQVTLLLEIKTDVYAEVAAALTELMNGTPAGELLETHFVDFNAKPE